MRIGNAGHLLVVIQWCMRRNDDELDDIVQHVEEQVADGTCSLVGWWNANATSDYRHVCRTKKSHSRPAKGK
jgi:hypothetical protein